MLSLRTQSVYITFNTKKVSFHSFHCNSMQSSKHTPWGGTAERTAINFTDVNFSSRTLWNSVLISLNVVSLIFSNILSISVKKVTLRFNLEFSLVKVHRQTGVKQLILLCARK